MAALTLTLARNKQRTRTFTTTGGGATDTIAAAQLTSGALAYGPIATFLATTFADEAAANAAAAAAGISLRAYGAGGVSLLRWVASASVPSAALTTAAASPLVVEISAPGVGG